MSKEVFSVKRTRGGILKEKYIENKWCFEYSENGKVFSLEAYSPFQMETKERTNLWMGHTQEELLASGRDIMGEKILSDGEPTIEKIRECMPEITDGVYTFSITNGAYSFLGGATSQGCLIVDTFGKVCPESTGRDRKPTTLFYPETADQMLGKEKPYQCLMGERLPIMFSVYKKDDKVMELIYFVEPGDTDIAPALWIRVKKYSLDNPTDFTLDYRIAACSREALEQDLYYSQISEEIFAESLADTVAYWLKSEQKGTQLKLPEKIVENVAKGSILFTEVTFEGERPRYGHKFYGLDLHDNFPPNIIWALEAFITFGKDKFAKRMFENMILYIINDEGRFNYRQGSEMLLGASAAEYGQILYLANKYKQKLGITKDNAELEEWIDKLIGMGKVLLSKFVKCEEFEGLQLIKMCAEADTNSRVFVYLGNNLWAIRGLNALSELLKEFGYKEAEEFNSSAQLVQKNIDLMLEKYSAKDTRFGDLPPFRFGYPATPLTLSICDDMFEEITEEQKEEYFKRVDTRSGHKEYQDITENTYANYRYYPEILSSMMLDENYTDSIVKMRENLGGELLGMTRFRSWVDNWPVMHYARFLIETGRIDKYLMLLYSHILHHGNPKLMCYYEQVYIDGAAKAPDCVPSLLTAPMMVAWMFAFEKISDGTLVLLGGLPKSWYNKPFEIKKIGYSGGEADIVSDGKTITLKFSNPLPKGTELVCPAKNVTSGMDYISKTLSDRVILKEGIMEAQFTF